MEATFNKPVFLKNGTELIRVQPENVVLLYTKKDYSYLINNDSKQPIVLTRSFSDLMKSYFGKHLIQIRRATAVNINYVKKIDGNEVTLLFGLKIEVTEDHIKDLAKCIQIV